MNDWFLGIFGLIICFILLGILGLLGKESIYNLEKYNNKQLVGIITMISGFSFILIFYQTILPYFYKFIQKIFGSNLDYLFLYLRDLIVIEFGFIFLFLGLSFFFAVFNNINYKKKNLTILFFVVFFMTMGRIISYEAYIQVFK